MNGLDSPRLDCLLIGYNETPVAELERLTVTKLGKDSGLYSDLKLQFVEPPGQPKMHFTDLLSHVWHEARGGDPDPFRMCDIPALGPVYLTNYLRRRGKRADWINLFQREKAELIEHLSADPVCIAVTTTLYSINLPVKEIVRFARRHNPRVPIVVGGPLIANHVRDYRGDKLAGVLGDLEADIFVNEFQGERTLDRIVDCLKNGGDLATVPNVMSFGEDGGLRINPAEHEENDLDEEHILWTSFPGRDLGPTIQTRTARSCAFSCSFCNYPRIGKLALAGVDTVKRELDSMRELGTVKNVLFIDDTFNVPLPRFKEICRMMIREGYGFDWYSYFRCSNSDEECIELMAESGCRGVFLGIESASASILQSMNKVADIAKYRRGIEWLSERGIFTFGSFIVGFPGETAETLQETVDFIAESKLDCFRTQLWYCEPGTPIFHEKEKYGIQGKGFDWSHNTMDSGEAAAHAERIFLSLDHPQWLTKLGFDFWIIPYLFGKGVTRDQLDGFLSSSRDLLRMELTLAPGDDKARAQQAVLDRMVGEIGG